MRARGLFVPRNNIIGHPNFVNSSRATGTPASRLWLSTSSNDDKIDSTAGLEKMDPPENITRAMFLGNILPLFEGAAGLVVTGISLALGLLYFQQDKLLYIPEIQGLDRPNESNPTGYQSPAEYNIPYETHMIETSTKGNFIHSWLMLHPDSKEQDLPTIIFFHGNAG